MRDSRTTTSGYTDFLYARQQRQGMLYRDCQRLVNLDRNVFAACMVACGDADAMVTGVTRNSFDALDEISRVIAVNPLCAVWPDSAARPRTHRSARRTPSSMRAPSPAQLADIATQAAAKAHELGPHSEGGAVVVFEFRQSDGQGRPSAYETPWRCSTGAASGSNTTAK